MREIKFRAWDKVRKTMYDVDTIEMDVLKDGSSDNQISGWDDTEWQCGIPLKDVELLQYTGEKDINGQEIYEGDIIRLEGVDDREIGSTWEHIGKIVYKRGAFFVCYFDYYADGDEELICDAQVEFGTVIGNKFENPELLEGK